MSEVVTKTSDDVLKEGNEEQPEAGTMMRALIYKQVSRPLWIAWLTEQVLLSLAGPSAQAKLSQICCPLQERT